MPITATPRASWATSRSTQAGRASMVFLGTESQSVSKAREPEETRNQNEGPGNRSHDHPLPAKQAEMSAQSFEKLAPVGRHLGRRVKAFVWKTSYSTRAISLHALDWILAVPNVKLNPDAKLFSALLNVCVCVCVCGGVQTGLLHQVQCLGPMMLWG